MNNRLGFTFCSGPTALDALAFAYLHSILNSADDNIRVEVARRVNLVAWEKRVRDVVNTTFTLEK
jgi:metaxin